MFYPRNQIALKINLYLQIVQIKKRKIMDDLENRSQKEIYSSSVRAGRRTYFFDVKKTRSGELFLTITESKKMLNDTGNFQFERHKIFLYKEDFEKFQNGLQEALNYIKNNQLSGNKYQPKQ